MGVKDLLRAIAGNFGAAFRGRRRHNFGLNHRLCLPAVGSSTVWNVGWVAEHVLLTAEQTRKGFGDSNPSDWRRRAPDPRQEGVFILIVKTTNPY